MFEQAALAVQDEAHFGDAKAILEQTFAPENVARYLSRLKGAKVRVREFERALERGLLGPRIVADYQALGDSDRGQLREMYLSLVEQVAPGLRARFFEIYAYY